MHKGIALAATLLLFAVTPLAAQSHRGTDPSGVMHVPDAPTAAAKAELTYPVLRIAVPAAQQTIWADDGRLEIAVTVHPPLRKDHAFVYKLDGERRVGPTKQSSVTLGRVFRGTHTVTVTVVDRTGHLVQNSAPVTVYVKHHTVIN